MLSDASMIFLGCVLFWAVGGMVICWLHIRTIPKEN